MKLIKPSFEILEQSNGLEGIYKQIERCGRTCYKSEDKITENSCRGFVERMAKSKHYAMLEHGTVYLQVSGSDDDVRTRYDFNKYSVNNDNYETGWQYITTNYRVIIENNWIDDLKYLCEPTKYHRKRVTVHFICNRQVSHEFVRHRVFSFAQESTRYCNYTKDKFGNELTFIKPLWFEQPPVINAPQDVECIRALQDIEYYYFNLIKYGWKPQQAATILPNALKTELIMTGFVDDWKHFFDLRALGTTGAPHPQAQELALPLYEEFKNREWL